MTPTPISQLRLARMEGGRNQNPTIRKFRRVKNRKRSRLKRSLVNPDTELELYEMRRYMI